MKQFFVVLVVLVGVMLVFLSTPAKTQGPCEVSIQGPFPQYGMSCGMNQVVVGVQSISPAIILCGQIQVSCN